MQEMGRLNIKFASIKKNGGTISVTCGSHSFCEFSVCNTNSLKDTNNLKVEEGQRPFMAGEVNVYRAHRGGGNSEGKV